MNDEQHPVLKVAVIAARSRNGVIGRGDKLPWHLPGDLRYFKSVTLNKPVLMGRKTFESIGRPLPGRTNIIISRNPDFKAPGIQVYTNLEQGLECARAVAEINGVDEVMVIGGAEIYRQSLPLAARLYLTQVHAEIHGDAYFPEIEPGDWMEVRRQDFAADEGNPHAYSFIVLDRIPA